MVSSASASASKPFLTARSMLSAGILYSRALSIAARKIGEVMSPLVCLEAVEISLAIFENIFDLAASVAAFLFLIFDHLLCPLIQISLLGLWITCYPYLMLVVLYGRTRVALRRPAWSNQTEVLDEA